MQIEQLLWRCLHVFWALLFRLTRSFLVFWPLLFFGVTRVSGGDTLFRVNLTRVSYVDTLFRVNLTRSFVSIWHACLVVTHFFVSCVDTLFRVGMTLVSCVDTLFRVNMTHVSCVDTSFRTGVRNNMTRVYQYLTWLIGVSLQCLRTSMPLQFLGWSRLVLSIYLDFELLNICVPDVPISPILVFCMVYICFFFICSWNFSRSFS